MPVSNEFREYILYQLRDMGDFETKNMFGGTALLRNGAAFAKIKHGALWLKTDESNINDFLEMGMKQYTYGKDNSRRLNFHETPADILEDPEILVQWANRACDAAMNSKK